MIIVFILFFFWDYNLRNRLDFLQNMILDLFNNKTFIIFQDLFFNISQKW